MATYKVKTMEEVNKLVNDYERKTNTVFSILRSTKNFGLTSFPATECDENEMKFETASVPYTGIPFFVAGLKIFQCKVPPTTKGPRKRRENIKEASDIMYMGEFSSVDSMKEESILSPHTKKRKRGSVTCNATIIVRDIVYYPEFRLQHHSKSSRMCAVRKFKESLRSGSNALVVDRVFYISLPKPAAHSGHSVCAPSFAKAGSKDIRRGVGSGAAGVRKGSGGPLVKKERSTHQARAVKGNIRKRIKVEDEDPEARLKLIRAELQAIMGLTYLRGTIHAYDQLLVDLKMSKQKYLKTLEECETDQNHDRVPLAPRSSHSVRVVESQDSLTYQGPPQVLTIQASNVVKSNDNVPISWPAARALPLPSSATVIPASATVVAVAGLPLAVTSSSGANPAVVAVPSTVSLPANPAPNAQDSSSQETSIFVEAMEAIFNSQI